MVIAPIPADRQSRLKQRWALKVLGGEIIRFLNPFRTMSRSLAAEQFAQATVDALTAHIAILDDKGSIIAVNRAWANFAAQNPPTPSNFAIGANYLDVCRAATGPCSEESMTVADGITAVLGRVQDEFSLEYPCHSPTEQRWFVVRVSRFVSEGPTRVVIAHENVTQRRLAEDRLRHVALHDALTGLPNRILFADRVGQALLRLKRNPASHFAVLFIDLDRFKVINDSMGHAAGDDLLKTIAQRLRVCVRETDSLASSGADVGGRTQQPDAAPHTVARMGGDEFTLVLDGLRDPGDAAIVAQRLLATIRQPLTFSGVELTTTASIGIVNGAPSYTTPHELLRDADSAMYQAKIAGKDRFVVFNSTMHAAAVSRMDLESDLRRALERGELLLHYQPIVSLATGEIRGFEALVRWVRGKGTPNATLINPAQFIPIAEDTGLIRSLGEWVLEEACQQLADWKRKFSQAANLSVSINVSGKQLVDDHLASHLQKVLRQTHLDPASIRLEITESILMEDRRDTMERLQALKETGILLSMDDFGTGYSSLSCLHLFPMDVLKIDRSFVQNLQGRRHAAAVVHAVVNLAHNVGMDVVAEGIETLQQAAFLQSLDCDLGQGYLFSKPLAAEQAVQYLIEPMLPTAAA